MAYFEFEVEGKNKIASFEGEYSCDFKQCYAADLEYLEGSLCLTIDGEIVFEKDVNIQNKKGIEVFASLDEAYAGLFKSIEAYADDADTPEWLEDSIYDSIADDYSAQRGY